MSAKNLYEQRKSTLYNPEIPSSYDDQDDWLFRTLSEATAIATGDRFFELLVESLANAYGIQKVYVTECIDEVKARTLAHWNQGDLVDNGEYIVTNLPCEIVMEGKLLYVPHSLQAFFPHVRYDSYIGVPLFDSTRRVIGHIVMEDTVPLAETPFGITALRVFAARAAAELERHQLERERMLAYQTLEQRVQERTAEIEQRRVIATSLQNILAMLNTADSYQAVLQYIAQVACELFDAYRGVVYAASNPEIGDYAIVATCGPSEGWPTAPVLGWITITKAVIQNEPQAGLCHEQNGQDSQQTDLTESCRASSILAIPLVLQNGGYGCLALYYRESLSLLAATLDLASAFGEQTNLALQNAQLRMTAEQAATLEERNRLAHELHDAVSQTLWSASLLADVMPALWDKDPEKGRLRLEQLRQLNRIALAELRALLLELRPSALAEVTVGDLLRQLVDSIQPRTETPITLATDGNYCIAPQTQVAIYRIVQEAVYNALRHAHATQIEVRLYHEPDQLRVTVADNGQGFDASTIASDSIGLKIMHERAESIAATLTIHSIPGRGTTVQLEWVK